MEKSAAGKQQGHEFHVSDFSSGDDAIYPRVTGGGGGSSGNHEGHEATAEVLPVPAAYTYQQKTYREAIGSTPKAIMPAANSSSQSDTSPGNRHSSHGKLLRAKNFSNTDFHWRNRFLLYDFPLVDCQSIYLSTVCPKELDMPV